MRDFPTPAGKLRHRLSIERNLPQTTESNFNQSLDNWQEIDRCWASIEPVSGREPWFGEQVQADVTHLIKRRYKHGVKLAPKDRAKFRGRIFNLIAVRNIEERNIELWCLAIEEV